MRVFFALTFEEDTKDLLAGFRDVAPAGRDVPRDGRDDPGPVGTGQNKDVTARHQPMIRTAAAALAASARASSALSALASATPMRR